jgi:hypothetical protein
MFITLWWTEIDEGVHIAIEVHEADRGPAKSAVAAKLSRRAFPLALSTCVLCVLLAPPAIAVLVDFFRSVFRHGIYTFKSYDAVDALFVAVWLTTLALTSMLLGKVRRLRRLLVRLNTP